MKYKCKENLARTDPALSVFIKFFLKSLSPRNCARASPVPITFKLSFCSYGFIFLTIWSAWPKISFMSQRQPIETRPQPETVIKDSQSASFAVSRVSPGIGEPKSTVYQTRNLLLSDQPRYLLDMIAY